MEKEAPFKSDAQRRWMYAAEARGEVPKGTAGRWQAHTPKGKNLPEHARKKKASAIAFARAMAKTAAQSTALSRMPAYDKLVKLEDKLRRLYRQKE